MTDWSSTVELAGCDPNWKDNISSLLDDIEWSIEIRPIVEKIRNGQRLDLTDEFYCIIIRIYLKLDY